MHPEHDRAAKGWMKSSLIDHSPRGCQRHGFGVCRGRRASRTGLCPTKIFEHEERYSSAKRKAALRCHYVALPALDAPGSGRFNDPRPANGSILNVLKSVRASKMNTYTFHICFRFHGVDALRPLAFVA